MADFVAIIRRAVDGLAENHVTQRRRVYEKARQTVERQLRNMSPVPSDDVTRRQLDKLEAAISEVELEYGDTPALAEQRSGLSFEVSRNGVFSLSFSGQATTEDLNEVASLRLSLMEMLDDLTKAAAGSNAFSHLSDMTARYRKNLEGVAGDLSLDQLYAEGLRLENARHRINSSIGSGDAPPMAERIAEALDSVVALHGPLIMSTERGRELSERARRYHFDANRERSYKDLSVQFANLLVAKSEIMDKSDADVLLRVNSELDSLPSRERSAEVAHTANRNLLVTIATFVVGAVASPGLANSLPGAIAADTVKHLVDGCYMFIVGHSQLLRGLAAVSGTELSWLPPFIRWFEQTGSPVRSSSFSFKIVARNGDQFEVQFLCTSEIMLWSESYKDMGSAISCIDSVKDHAPDAAIIDLTENESGTGYRFEVAESKSGEFFVRFVASNGETIARSETYAEKRDAMNCAQGVAENSLSANVEDET